MYCFSSPPMYFISPDVLLLIPPYVLHLIRHIIEERCLDPRLGLLAPLHVGVIEELGTDDGSADTFQI